MLGYLLLRNRREQPGMLLTPGCGWGLFGSLMVWLGGVVGNGMRTSCFWIECEKLMVDAKEHL